MLSFLFFFYFSVSSFQILDELPFFTAIVCNTYRKCYFLQEGKKYALNNKYLQALGINSQEKTIVQIYKHNMDTYQQWQEITNTTFATSKTKQVHYHFRDFQENNHDVLSQCTSKNSYPGHKKRSTHSLFHESASTKWMPCKMVISSKEALNFFLSMLYRNLHD